ncbi:6-carboxytetrahydropterin synthase QueD, partial [bacterium]|nr:6-carboxytetrahydropterin synthase QueD [bacterium]
MYEIKIIDEFSAAHRLKNYKGKCENLHGHNWKVEVVISGEFLDKTGLLLDFGILKEKLNFVLKKLDHKNLNRISFFYRTNPTSENIAYYIFIKMKTLLK